MDNNNILNKYFIELLFLCFFEAIDDNFCLSRYRKN